MIRDGPDGARHTKGDPERSHRTAQKSYLRAFNRSLLLGDVTGDGRSDLLIESTYRELRVFVSVPGPDLFARRPQEMAVAVPNDEEYTWLVDLNKDGKQDVLMHHPLTTEPHRHAGLGGPARVIMLIAREGRPDVTRSV